MGTSKSLPVGSVGFSGILFVLRPAFHEGFFAWTDRDGRALFLGDRLLAKHTNALLVLSLFLHRRTPGRILGRRGVLDTLQEIGGARQ